MLVLSLLDFSVHQMVHYNQITNAIQRYFDAYFVAPTLTPYRDAGWTVL